MQSVAFALKYKRSALARALQIARRVARKHGQSRVLALVVLALFAVFAPSRAVRAQACRVAPESCPKAAAAETPRGLALGTGLRASSVSTSALAYSPAALALGNLYHIEGNVDYLAALNTVALGAAAVDSSTSKIGAGIALRGFLSGDDGNSTSAGHDYNGLDGRVGIALSLSDAFSLGVGGRYISLSTEDDRGSDAKLAQGFTMDASLRIIPVSGLQIDLAALNIIDLDSPFVPVTLSASVAIAAAQSLSLGMDVLADMTTFDGPYLTLGGGVEYLGGNSVPIRAGYSYDFAREIHSLGVGIGYTDQRIGLDLGLRQELAGGSDTRVMAAIRYYVN
jgi:hypothetical protein